MSCSGGEISGSGAARGGAGWSGFSVHVGEVAGAGVVRVAGELDCMTAAQLGDGLSRASLMPGTRVVVDFSRLTFMDAAGLGVLIAAHQRLVAQGREGLVIRGASGIVRRICELSGVSALLGDRQSAASSSDAAAEGLRRALDVGRRDAGLSVERLFVAYFALGGTAELGHLVAYLNGDAASFDLHQRDILVHAVNERLGDVGRTDHLLSYASA